MHLVEVGTNPQYQHQFIQFPVRLYHDEPNWIRPLDADLESVFDPKKNKLFETGECIRWLLLNDENQTIGRVAAFVNQKTVITRNEQPTGGMGFFECVYDQKAAYTLFDACKTWLADRGMEAMDGPINFGDRDRWWGLLVEGFEHEPNYGMPYTKPYYVLFFENYGFRDYFQQHTVAAPIEKDRLVAGMHPTVMERAKRIMNDPDYSFEHIRKNQLPRFAVDFAEIYNKAWTKILGTPDMSQEKALKLMKQMKPVMDEQLIWFGYYGPEKQPIAFFIMLPELNQYFKHVNGKMNWLGKLKFLYYKTFKPTHKAFGLIFGVVPEFQGRGVESAIAMSYPMRVGWSASHSYKDMDLNWIGDFNVKMIRFSKMLGGVVSKRHITYRYLFDRTKEFKRHPVI